MSSALLFVVTLALLASANDPAPFPSESALTVTGPVVVTLPPNMNAADVANKLKALPNIESAEPGPTPQVPPAPAPTPRG